MDLSALAFIALIGVQEGNPCQESVSVVAINPNRIAYHIEDIDKLGVTTLEYVTFLEGGSEPQSRTKIPRVQLSNTSFINCYTMVWDPPPNLARDGKTRYVVSARTEDVNMRVSSWSAPSNPFTLGTVVPPPDPPPLPVPGVRVGTSTPN
jgi:hypothetical protein